MRDRPHTCDSSLSEWINVRQQPYTNNTEFGEVTQNNINKMLSYRRETALQRAL